MANRTWMASGLAVVPVKGSFRRCEGGYCVDVRSSDPRTTVTYWTENASNVVDADGNPYTRTEG